MRQHKMTFVQSKAESILSVSISCLSFILHFKNSRWLFQHGVINCIFLDIFAALANLGTAGKCIST